MLEAGELVVDRRARQVRLRGVPVSLAGREFDLAVKLATDPHRVFTKDELLRDVWGYGAGSSRARSTRTPRGSATSSALPARSCRTS